MGGTKRTCSLLRMSRGDTPEIDPRGERLLQSDRGFAQLRQIRAQFGERSIRGDLKMVAEGAIGCGPAKHGGPGADDLSICRLDSRGRIGTGSQLDQAFGMATL